MLSYSALKKCLPRYFLGGLCLGKILNASCIYPSILLHAECSGTGLVGLLRSLSALEISEVSVGPFRVRDMQEGNFLHSESLGH